MIGQDSIQRILDSALHVSKADETESKFLLSDSMFAHGYRVPPVKVASFNFTGATQ